MYKISVCSDWFKYFALVAMTAAHIDLYILHTNWLNNTLGRMAFPLFAFLLLKNFCQYHPIKKYIFRLTLFGLLTQACFFLFKIQTGNILFTFLYAIIFLSLAESLCKKYSFLNQAYYLTLLFLILFPFILISAYSLPGFFFLLALYAYFHHKSRLNYWAVIFTTLAINSTDLIATLSSLFTMILLLNYVKIKNGARLIKWWAFYIYYPLHIILLNALAYLFE